MRKLILIALLILFSSACLAVDSSLKLEEADKLKHEGQYMEALQMYEAILTEEPSNEAALKGKEDSIIMVVPFPFSQFAFLPEEIRTEEYNQALAELEKAETPWDKRRSEMKILKLKMKATGQKVQEGTAQATIEAEKMLKETLKSIKSGISPLSKYFDLEEKLGKYQLKLQLELRDKAPEVFSPTMQALRSVFQKEGWLLPEDAIEFDVLVEGAREGQLAEFDISIKNNLKYPIVLISLSTENPYDGVYSWQKAHVGSVYYDEEKDLYVYDPATEEATQNLFNEGLLFSGEALGLSHEYRVLTGKKEFKLDFVVLNQDRLWQVYLLKSRDGNLEIFERADREKLQEYKASYRSGILFFDDGTGIRTKDFVSSFEAGAATFPAAAALKKLKIKAAPYTYSNVLGGWVIKKGGIYFLVRPQGKIRLPEVDLSVFDLVDKKERLRVELSSRAKFYYKGVLDIQRESSQYEDGFFADMDKKDLLKVLRIAQKNKLQVGLNYYFLDNARLLIR